SSFSRSTIRRRSRCRRPRPYRIDCAKVVRLADERDGFGIVFLCGASAYSQQTQRGQTSSIREIIPGHYLFSSGDLNSGIIATNEGVVVFDALDSEAVARAEREAIADTIRQPVRFLVSSPTLTLFQRGTLPTRMSGRLDMSFIEPIWFDSWSGTKHRHKSRKRGFPIRRSGTGSRSTLVARKFRFSISVVRTHEATASFTFRRTELFI